MAKLTESDVRAIRRAMGQGKRTPTELARAHRMTTSAIVSAAYGVTWNHVPGAITPVEYRQGRRTWLAAQGRPIGSAKRHQGQTMAELSVTAHRFIARHRRGRESVGNALARLLDELQERRGASPTRLVPSSDTPKTLPQGTARIATWIPKAVAARARREAARRGEAVAVTIDRLLRELRARRLRSAQRLAARPAGHGTTGHARARRAARA